LKLRNLSKIGIVGPGLLGGSIGLAIKSHNPGHQVIGVGHRTRSVDRAKEIGAIDQGSLEIRDLAECDLVIIATPIGLIRRTIEELGEVLAPDAIVTDVGSTKRSICRWGKQLARRKIDFIGSHPIAGSEKRGVDFARPDLFINADCFVTPMAGNNPQAVDLVCELWQTLGMRVVKTTPSKHDKLLAAVSHLPHMVAAGLVNVCGEDQIKFSGTGFMDTTRIASGDVNLWHDIIVSNSDYLSAMLKKFTSQLEKVRQAIEKGDSKAICAFLEKARTRREDLVRFKYQQQQIEP
jgi:prephenate dehydrogenase